jgi:hypothetical protein
VETLLLSALPCPSHRCDFTTIPFLRYGSRPRQANSRLFVCKFFEEQERQLAIRCRTESVSIDSSGSRYEAFPAFRDIVIDSFPLKVILQLHRQFFTKALSTPEEPFTQRHKYAPSVVAIFLSASRLIASLHEFHNREPLLAGRILGYWSNAHSAAVRFVAYYVLIIHGA